MVEYGFTQAAIQKILDDTSDLIPMPAGFDKTKLHGSPLEGQGLFAIASIKAGELIGPSRRNGCRTPAGRFINHSVKPNAMFEQLPSSDLDTIALHDIESGQELFVDYRQVGSVNGWMRPCDKAEAMRHCGQGWPSVTAKPLPAKTWTTWARGCWMFWGTCRCN
jgi:hypothetical protein